MRDEVRGRFWAEALGAVASGALGLLTLVHSTWIETVFRADPDRSSGSTEWLIVAVLCAAAIALAIAARYEWRREVSSVS